MDSPEEQSQVPIAFSASIGKSTKANPSAFPTSSTFGVNAYFKTQSGNYQFEDDGLYFKNLLVSNSSGVWKGNDIYYWPPTGNLKFVAYSPYNKASLGYESAKGVKLSNFTQDATASMDLMYAETGDLTTTSSPVPLIFNHALTQLYFTIQTAQHGFTFKIKELSLKKLYYKGEFVSKPSPVWTMVGTNDANYTVYSGSGVLISYGKDYGDDSHGDPDDNTSYVFSTRLFVVPQEVTAVQLYIKYDLMVLNTVNLADQEKTITLTGSPWLPNQLVEYAISISQSNVPEITYTPTITDWTAETEKPIAAN
jgi:hypothetical protein